MAKFFVSFAKEFELIIEATDAEEARRALCGLRQHEIKSLSGYPDWTWSLQPLVWNATPCLKVIDGQLVESKEA